MGSIFNRLRRRPHEDPTTHQRADTTTDEGSHPTEITDHKTIDPEKHDPNVAVSGDSPVADLDDETDLPDDVKELPKIVRNIVSLEDGT
jgi:hypothetical protein